MSREENVTTVPMETCLEDLLNVNPGASIQLDGAARLIRKCHNSTLEIHHVCHVRSKLSHVAVTVSITLQYLNGPEVYHFDLWFIFSFDDTKIGTLKIVNEETFSFKDEKFVFWAPFLIFRWICMIFGEINSVAISLFSCFLFHQEVCSSKNYRAFGFRLADKQLTSSRRITICQVECRSPIKICSFSFFRIWSAIAQQITSDLRWY